MTKKQKFLYTLIFSIFLLIVSACFIRVTFSKTPLPQPKNQQTNQQLSIQDIDWDTATKLVKDCQIASIYQSRSLQVSLRSQDRNTVYYTSEPKFNDIINLLQEVQGPCDIIPYVTE